MSINQIINKEDISMKKMYETPEVEVVKFQYRDQVVAASGYCIVVRVYNTMGHCDESSNPTPNKEATQF